MLDLHNNIEARRALSPVSVADDTAQVSEIVDRQHAGSLELVILIGSVADVDATFTVLLEDGDDSGLSDAAAVADEFLIGTEAGAGFQFDDDDTTRKIGYRGVKRFVRATITPANNLSAALLAAVWLVGAPRVAPVADA